MYIIESVHLFPRNNI